MKVTFGLYRMKNMSIGAVSFVNILRGVFPLLSQAGTEEVRRERRRVSQVSFGYISLVARPFLHEMQ